MKSVPANPVVFKGSPLFPLPADYDDLGAEGRRLARVNACCNIETPEDAVQSWAFFRKYYLGNDLKDEEFQNLPYKFYKDLLPSPPMHYSWVHSLFKYQLNALGAPRYSAKSIVIGTEIPLWLPLIKPYYEIDLILSKDQFVEERLEKIEFHWEENPRIVEDFGRVRGATWNKHVAILQNRAQLRGISIEGKSRGRHPHLIIPDDVEQDLEEIGDFERFLDRLEHRLFTVMLPMLGPTDRLTWIGTLDHLRSFLYYIIKSENPRFRFWNRLHHLAEEEDGTLAWAEKFSHERLEDLREMIGEEAYQSQYQGCPISSGARILRLSDERHLYWFDGPEPYRDKQPMECPTVLVHRMTVKNSEGDSHLEEKREDWVTYASQMRRFITVDYAPTQKDTSDYSVVHVMGQSPPDILWSLDLFVGRVNDGILIRKIWEMVERWYVRIVGVEAVSTQEALYYNIRTDLKECATRLGWTPQIVPIKYPPSMSKSSRIQALEWRFNRDAIRLPKQRLDLPFSPTDPYRMLKAQIMSFTPDMRGLQYDDAIDTLAMHARIVQSAGPEQPPTPIAEDDLFEKLRKGELVDMGIPLISGVPFEMIPQDVINAVRVRQYNRKFGTHSRKYNWSGDADDYRT